MDLSGLVDMNYFWWSVNKVMAFAMPFLVIFLAISCVGWLLITIIQAFRQMRKG